ncbi:MAG TPA: hypothetical protein VN696_02235 [Pyrinomonadaceae bacterium]|nr:hypothetical protein [Pyrinomonadaceae bacterium]
MMSTPLRFDARRIQSVIGGRSKRWFYFGLAILSDFASLRETP